MFPSTRRLTLAICCAAMAAWGWPALAEDVDCTCTTAISQKKPGRVVWTRGKVLASERDGLLRANAGTRLRAGSRVITANASEARVAIGTCSVRMKSNSELTIERRAGALCLAVNETSHAGSGVAGEGGTDLLGAAAILGGVGVGGLIAAGGGGGGGGPIGGGDIEVSN